MVLKPGSSLDLVNLLSLCFGYCSPLVQSDCNKCNVNKVLKSAVAMSISARPPRALLLVELLFFRL